VVRVPVPTRPAVLAFLGFHIAAPLFYFCYRLRHGARFDLVQFVSSDLTFGDISSSHFCNRSYMRHHWKQSQSEGLRRLSHWLLYQLGSLAEPLAYRRAQLITVCSRGLGKEIGKEYPFAKRKIRLCQNGVDFRRMQPPADFNREGFRAGLGMRREDIVLSFTALGAFGRKGLPHLLEGMSIIRNPELKLVVVGGPADMVLQYRHRAVGLGLANQVAFVGNQDDVRPYLWASDGFAFPSHYEAFPLAVLEAAAAGLPLIVTSVSGVEEFLMDGINGILIADRSPDGVRRGLSRFLDMSVKDRQEMGARARLAVSCYSLERFVSTWGISTGSLREQVLAEAAQQRERATGAIWSRGGGG